MLLEPPPRDRMAGDYVKKRGGEICHWPTRPGASCSGKCGWAAGRRTKWRRGVERRLWRRHAATAMREEAAAEDAENDPETDCRHGCNGFCELRGSDVCTFRCHPPFVEMFGTKYDDR